MPIALNSRPQWRAWLRKNHKKHSGVWVRLYKKHVGRGLTYSDAVEEALCFGWIDGQLRRIDDRRHLLWFSRRRSGSTWAPSNIARVKKLIRQKKMTAVGLKVFRTADLTAQTAPSAARPKSDVPPNDLRRALAHRPTALKHFLNYPPSFRRTAIWWVISAKLPATRRRRIRNIVANSARYARAHY